MGESNEQGPRGVCVGKQDRLTRDEFDGLVAGRAAIARRLSMHEVVEMFRADPKYARLVAANYWDADTLAAAERFAVSPEFQEVFRRASEWWPATVLDVGAGTGIATYAFLANGAKHAYALEPDPSALLGRGAISRITEGMPCTVLDSTGERIPLADGIVDVVYAREVLHHASDLSLMLRECARVLRQGGLLIVCREHVADDEAQKREFLAGHSVHRYTGLENAYTLEEYLASIEGAGLTLKEVIGPYDSAINLYGGSSMTLDVDQLPAEILKRKAGAAGHALAKIPGAKSLVRISLRHRHAPGRLYSFLAVK